MIQIEKTPNPNAIKFIGNKKFSSVGSQEFQSKNIGEVKNVFIKKLLELEGVELIFVSEDFLSVKKNDKVKWETLQPTIISFINDFFEKNNKPILTETLSTDEGTKKDEVSSKIIEVLDTKVRPAVARDGGDIKFISFKNGVVKVELKGSCSGCPSSVMTLKQGVQNILCHYVKEVKSVEAIQ
tara:strand:- start:2539 stop:3087 length:549 start_codon:yes stop_codon:yes gene_type:complete